MKGYVDTRETIKNILVKNKIDIVLKLNEKSLSAFADSLILDLHYLEYGARKIPFDIKSYLSKVFVFFIAITFSNVLYLFKRIGSVSHDFSKTKYIFLPFSDLHYIRFKRIPEIVSQDYTIIYPPAFHIKGIDKHRAFFLKKTSSILTPSFGFVNSFKFLFFALQGFKKINNASKELSGVFSVSAKDSFQSGICMSIAYQLFISQLTRSISNQNKNKIVWFFDFDKDYKYISFHSEIKKKRKTDTTVHIQHGLFWDNNIAYTYPNADYIFCCCKREKEIIQQTVEDRTRAIDVGAPLQCFDNSADINDNSLKHIKSHFIVLLTDTVTPSLLQLQIDILLFLKSSENLDYRLRLRPSSREEDLRNFGENIDISKISINSTLYDDLNTSEVVISFSFDALIECFKLNKPILLGNDSNSCNLNFIFEATEKDTPIHVFNDLKEFKYLLESPSGIQPYDSKNNTFIRNNFGELDFNKIKTNYSKAINIIEHSL